MYLPSSIHVNDLHLRRKGTKKNGNSQNIHDYLMKKHVGLALVSIYPEEVVTFDKFYDLLLDRGALYDFVLSPKFRVVALF